MAGFGSLAPSYDPMTGLPIGAEPAPEGALPAAPQGALSKVLSRLTGTQFGEPRLQTWPEKLLRSAVTLPGDVVSGAEPMLPPGLRREDYTDAPPPSGLTVAAQPNDPVMERAQDLAGMAGGGMVFGRMAQPAAAVAHEAAAVAPKEPIAAPKPAVPTAPVEPSVGPALDWDHGPSLLSDSAAPGAPVAALEHAAPFYSGVERAVEALPMNKASGEQWLGTLANRPGVKPEEMDWTGLKDFLAEKGSAPVTKAEVQAHLADNGLKLGEVNKGDIPWEKLSPARQDRVADDFHNAYPDAHTSANPDWGAVQDFYNEQRAAGEYRTGSGEDGTKYHGYQLPGGENYREKLLTLPHVDPDKIRPDAQATAKYLPEWNRIKAEIEPFNQRFEQGDSSVLPEINRLHDQLSGLHGKMIDETLSRVPAEQRQPYKSSHWDEPNVLVHRRTNERDVSSPGFTVQNARSGNKSQVFGSQAEAEAYQASLPEAVRGQTKIVPDTAAKPSLHLEEIQSDWHQAGRKQGYRVDEAEKARLTKELQDVQAERSRLVGSSDPADRARYAEIAQKEADLTDNYNRVVHDGVPDAPFKKNWHELALKDAIREAAEKGFDRISWTPGEAQAARYDLSKVADKISYARGPDGSYSISVRNGRNEVLSKRGLTEKQLEETIGKEPTKKIVDNVGRDVGEPEGAGTLQGLDLKVGGEGMKGFYDKMIPDAMNKIGKPHGVKVQKGSLKGRDSGAISGSDAMDRMTGQPGWEDMPRRSENRGEWFSNLDRERREELFNQARNVSGTVHYMDIPPSLKEQALKKGFSLFEDAAATGAPLAAAEHAAGQSARDSYLAAYGQDAHPAARETAPAAPRGNEPGGAGGGDAGLREAQAAAARRAGNHAPLESLPTKAMKIGDEYFVPGPIGKVRDVAAQYMADRETPSYHTPPTKYHPLDEEHSKAIARAFDEMKHDPNDPATKASYDALIKETAAQYQAVKNSGLKIEPIPAGAPDPYAKNPRLAAKDVADNNHLWFFPTDAGFGSNPGAKIDMATHPMMRKTGEKIGNHELLANDMFRIVHDYFGHLKEGYGFRAAGEDNAWRSHASMYSDLARPAMTTETRGQNSWVNYGPHGEHNRTASAADTVYADQKVGLMPEWTMRDRGSPEPTIAYHGSPYSFDKFDPAHIGAGEGNQAYGQGLYFAKQEPVSEWYRHQLAARRDPILEKHGLDAQDGSEVGMRLAATNGDPAPAIADLEKEIASLRSDGDTSKGTQNMIARRRGMINYLKDADRTPGHMYQVAIDHPPEQFLDWETPIAQHPESIRKAIEAHPQAARLLGNDVVRGQLKGPTGESVISRLGGNTESLKAAGIAGIRYPGSSPVKGERSTNYVTFGAPRLLKKYAAPGLIGAGGFGSLAPRKDR